MSLFQNYPPVRSRINLSFGIEKALLQALSENSLESEDAYLEIISSSYSLVYPEKIIHEAMPFLVKRVTERLQELKADQEKPKHPNIETKSLGTAYSKWLTGLDGTALCLYLTNYHIPDALELYWKEDILVVQEAIKTKGQQDSQTILARMEASMYGFGGKYSDDDAGAETFVMGSEEAQEALKSIGF